MTERLGGNSGVTWPLAFVAISCSVAIWPAADSFERPKLACAIIGIIAGLFFGRPAIRGPYTAPLCAMGASFVLPCLVSGSWNGFWWGSEAVADGFVGFIVGALLLLTAQASQANRPVVLGAWLVGAILAATYGIVQRFLGDPIPWDVREAGILDALVYRPFSFLGNPSFLAIVLAMALPICLVVPRRLGVIGLLVCGFALSLTMSRAGISMGLLGLILGGFLLPSKRVFAVIGVTAMLGGLLASGWNAPTSASRRFEQVGGGSSIVRLELYGAGVRAFAEKPLVGWGPGNVRQALVSDSAANLTESERLNPSYHNLFLDSAAQRGILGLFGTIWFLILVAKDFAKKRETALALSGLAFLGCVLVGFTTVGPWLSVCLLVGLASHSRAAT